MSIDLGDSIGALEIGSSISIFLFGIETLQTYNYYRQFQKDSRIYKFLVAGMWLLELGHTIGVAFEVYRATITLYGKPQLLVRFPALGAITILGGLVTMIVQVFYSLRVWKVLPDPYRYIAVFCVLLSLLRLIGSIFLAIQAITATNIAVYRVQWSWLITSLLAGGAATDLIIAGSLLYYLAQKRATAFNGSTRLIDRLVGITVRTGVVTSVAAVILIICFQAMPTTMIWLAMYTVLAKLYSNTLLSTLNSRQDLRNAMPNSSAEVYSKGQTSRREAIYPTRTGVISIEMKTTTETMGDDKKISLDSPQERGFLGPETSKTQRLNREKIV